MQTEEAAAEALTVEQLLYAMIALGAVAIVALVATLVATRLKKELPKPVRIGAYAMFGVSAIACVAFAVTCGIAKTHGMYTMDMAAEKLLPAIAKSPEDQGEQYGESIGYKKGSLIDPTTKSGLVVMYRFSCGDCEHVYEDLSAKLKSSQLPYWWVSSRSEVGRALCERYGIDQVPAIIAFDKDGKMSIGQIHTTNDGRVTVDEQAWKIALEHARQ